MSSILKYVIAVHHGCASKNALTKAGEEQIRLLSESISDLIKGSRRIQLLTSPAPRALETARIIGHLLNGVEPHQINSMVHTEFDYGVRQMETVMTFAARHEVAIAVVGGEAPLAIINSFSESVCKRTPKPTQVRKVREGCALCITLNDGNITHLPNTPLLN